MSPWTVASGRRKTSGTAPGKSYAARPAPVSSKAGPELAKVLVTRPQPGAARTARRLAELGHRPVELPLTRTVALPVEAASFDRPVDAVAVTSANALRHAPPELVARLADRPCFAVGE